MWSKGGTCILDDIVMVHDQSSNADLSFSAYLRKGKHVIEIYG